MRTAHFRGWIGASATLAVAVAVLGVSGYRAAAQSTIAAGQEHVFGANIGWISARAAPEQSHGLRVGEFFCSGYLYSANVGWINCGDGIPQNGKAYANNSATDYGLNTLEDGRLDGYAYGANIGWIKFDSTSATPPRYDLLTGKLSGYAYSANVGWINLGEGSVHINATVASLAPAPDTDADGMPDAWELMQPGVNNLTLLSGNGADLDGDGQSDRNEYLAGTDPLDPDDKLTITLYQPQSGYTSAQLSFTSRETRLYEVQTSTTLDAVSWQDVGLGEFLGEAEALETTKLVGIDQSTDASRYWRVISRRPLLEVAQ